MTVVRNAFPGPPLFPFVDRFWSWEIPAEGQDVPVQLLPGTGSDLIFHFAPPPMAREDGGTACRLPPSYLMALRSRILHFFLPPGSCFLSVRFRAGALRHFCDVPMERMVDIPTDAFCIWGGEVLALMERMAAAQSFEARVRIAEEWLLCRFRLPNARDAGVDWAIRRMYYGCSHVRMDDLLDGLGVGARQFQRLVKSGLGMGPKEHVRLSRFQQAAKAMLLSGSGYGAGDVQEGGYFDQSHFIRDFKEYAGRSPGDFLRASKGKSHFYNTSRPDNVILRNTK